VEPVSLAEAKAHLRITAAEDDALIAGYLLSATRAAEDYVRGKFVTQTWDYTLDYEWPMICGGGYYHYRIELPLHPVVSVSSVSYVDNNGAAQTLSSLLYTVHKNGPVPYIEKAYDSSWPTIRTVPAAITVRFVVGYPVQNVPPEITSAVLLGVEMLYDRNPNDREILESARNSLLDPYRMLRVS
jgi:uncharacterized phiE125 gp8 family phage protein